MISYLVCLLDFLETRACPQFVQIYSQISIFQFFWGKVKVTVKPPFGLKLGIIAPKSRPKPGLLLARCETCLIGGSNLGSISNEILDDMSGILALCGKGVGHRTERSVGYGQTSGPQLLFFKLCPAKSNTNTHNYRADSP